MTVDEALVIIDATLEPNHLNSIQELVFKQCWLDWTCQRLLGLEMMTMIIVGEWVHGCGHLFQRCLARE
ncbi:MAG: hypothetical protein MJA27_09235 [Pseudanabaenales cyanobacterium]|nr:hypothetical protein [Pseudanabaenales cyanobacterium]